MRRFVAITGLLACLLTLAGAARVLGQGVIEISAWPDRVRAWSAAEPPRVALDGG